MEIRHFLPLILMFILVLMPSIIWLLLKQVHSPMVVRKCDFNVLCHSRYLQYCDVDTDSLYLILSLRNLLFY